MPYVFDSCNLKPIILVCFLIAYSALFFSYQMAGFLQSLAYRFSVNILCYDYSGYGGSSGQRLEENLYADADAVLNELRERFNVPLNRIVLYGQSIGTAPTVELATKYKVCLFQFVIYIYEYIHLRMLVFLTGYE